MIKNLRLKKLQRSLSSGLNFSKIYLKKPVSIVIIAAYATTVVLVLTIFGFSKLISPTSSDSSVPSLPDSEPFTFLPADNLEVPALGDVKDATSESAEKTAPETTASTDSSEVKEGSPSYSAPATVSVPVIVETEVVKTVEVEKEVVKTIKKETPTVIEQENPPEPEQYYYDNYDAPEDIPYTPPEPPKNFPDLEPEETPEQDDQKEEVEETSSPE